VWIQPHPPQQRQQQQPIKQALATPGACFVCGGFGHFAHECLAKQQPQAAPRAAAPKRTGNVPKKNAQLHFVTAEEAQVDNGVIIGTLPINSISARLLFDSGASHSFIHEGFARDNKFPTMEFGRGFWISAPRIMLESNQIISQARLEIAGLEFIANLIVLKLGNDVDVILGMKWMVKH